MKKPAHSESRSMSIFRKKLSQAKSSALLLSVALACSPVQAADIRIVGSKALEPILSKWAASVSPDIKVQIATPGTSVAPKALIQGKADIAAMNREMVYEETENFIRVAGYYPSFVVIAIEAVGIYTHRDNPITGASYADIQRIFSGSGGCLKDSRVTTWGMLGVKGEWANQQIVALGQDAKSPAADFIKRTVQCRGSDIIAPVEEKITPLISAEKQKEIEIPGLSDSKIIAKISEEMENRTLRLDTIENIYLTETVGDTKETMVKGPIATEKLFSVLGTRIPSVLLRSLGPKFMLGVHVFNGNSSFLILKTDFYENAFLGLLKWENDMPGDLLPALGVKLTNENKYLLDIGFRDITIKNIDSRAILDQSGKAILIYAIPNKDTIVITTGEDTLNEIEKDKIFK